MKEKTPNPRAESRSRGWRRPYRKPAIESAQALNRDAVACAKSTPACGPDFPTFLS